MFNRSDPTNENPMKNSRSDPPALKDANPQVKICPDTIIQT